MDNVLDGINGEDDSYTGVVKDSVINVKKEDNKVIFTGVCKLNSFEELIRDYFDLDTDYNNLKDRLSKIDENLNIATKYGKRHKNFKSGFMGMYNFFYNFSK